MSEQKPPPWRLADALTRPFGFDLALLILPVALTAVVLGLLPLRDWDYWWHLSVGRAIDVYQAVPASNHYLYTERADAPSIYPSWLAQWSMLKVHALGGVYLNLTLRNLLAAVAFGVAGAVAARRAVSPSAGALAGCVGLLIASPMLFAGPSAYGALLGALTLAAALGVHDRALSPAWLYGLCLAAALWANLGMTFFTPAAVALPFALHALWQAVQLRLPVDSKDRARARRRALLWWSVLLLSCAATLLNPRGPELLIHLSEFGLAPSLHRGSLMGLAADGQLLAPAALALLGSALLSVIAWASSERLRRDTACVSLLVVAHLGAAASLALLPLLGLVFACTTAPALSGRIPDPIPRREHSSWRAIGLSLLLLAATVGTQRLTDLQDDWIREIQPFRAREAQPLAGVAPPETPVDHVAILNSFGFEPRVFHAPRFAGFLLFHTTGGRPQQMLFVDHRVDLPSDQVRDLHRVVSRGEAWRGVFQQYGVNSALLDKVAQAGLVEAMTQDEAWDATFEDDFTVLFLRRRP